MAIGFSILAYRLQGLRSGDLLALMQALQDWCAGHAGQSEITAFHRQADMKLQSGIVYHKRLANRTFVKLVVKASDGTWHLAVAVGSS